MPSCDNGWTVYNDYCYKKLDKFLMDFESAVDLCDNAHDSSILTINSKAEHLFVSKYFSTIESNIWVDVANSKYIDWFSKSSNEGGECAALHFFSGKDSKLISAHCEQKYEIVCKAQKKDWKSLVIEVLQELDLYDCLNDICFKPTLPTIFTTGAFTATNSTGVTSGSPTLPPSTTLSTTTKKPTPSTTLTTKTPTTTANPGCDANWMRFKDKCLHLSTQHRNHHDAEEDCQKKGGHLASIHSNSEIDFDSTLFTGMAWTGGQRKGVKISHGDYWLRRWHGRHRKYDKDHQKDFVWTDGSPWDYTSWYSNEPKCEEDKNCCVSMVSHYHWIAYKCTEKLVYICQKPVLEL